tara:strand:- start:310 stop:663 length:354 start_codon:yes stop_codon:yes gene_type:complete
MNYNSDFRFDLALGQLTEKQVADIFSNDKIEVKDESAKSRTTGNVFIEFESRNKPSGIATTQADKWCFKLSEVCFLFVSVENIKRIAREILKEKGFVKGGDNNTSKGVLVPIIKLIY